MLISLAAVPKTGGGKYADLCRISMLRITSTNYQETFLGGLPGVSPPLLPTVALCACALPDRHTRVAAV